MPPHSLKALSERRKEQMASSIAPPDQRHPEVRGVQLSSMVHGTEISNSYSAHFWGESSHSIAAMVFRQRHFIDLHKGANAFAVLFLTFSAVSDSLIMFDLSIFFGWVRMRFRNDSGACGFYLS